MSKLRLGLHWVLGLTLVLNLGVLRAAEQPGPAQLVKQTTEQVLRVLQERRDELAQNPQPVHDIVRDIVLPHFDFELMSRFVLAQNWRTASEEQRRRFVEEFRELLVRTYATSLAEYSGQTVEYKPMNGEPERGRVTVRTEVIQPAGPAIPVDYNLHDRDGAWKVFDVVIDGVSLVQNYRGSFNSEIRRNGMDALLESLSQRNRQQSAQ